MTKRIRSFSATITIIFLAIIGAWSAVYAQTGATQVTPVEENEIKKAVENYFEIRYRALSTISSANANGIAEQYIADSPHMKPEVDKLEIEIQHAKQYHLRYSTYNLILEFKEISYNPITQLVSVSVIEGHDVLFEITEELSRTDPVMSSMRNLHHVFEMRKEQNEWKIVSDEYLDYLWQFMKATGLGKDDLLPYMNETSVDITQPVMMTSVAEDGTTACSLPSDDTTHEYNRNGAVAYAHRWATAPPPYNHPPYDDYTNLGGDCTNFVSQAIHEGGNAEMVFGGSNGVGTLGWYYYNVNDRATAWNEVSPIYEFITQYWVWDGGPEGCDVPEYEAYDGDLIQYSWDNDGFWDHSVIIVRSEDYGYHIRYHWIAGHTPDTDDYPYTHYIYDYPNMAYRLIHIERIDGLVHVDLPIVLFEDGSGMESMSSTQNPYPGPQEPVDLETTFYPEPYPTP